MYADEVKVVPSSQLQKGDFFICEAGDTIPMDGQIVKGLATIDESAITGESAPVIILPNKPLLKITRQATKKNNKSNNNINLSNKNNDFIISIEY